MAAALPPHTPWGGAMNSNEANKPAMTATSSRATSDEWLNAPWAGAMMRCIADPAADLDIVIASDWPDWMPLGTALADPYIRVKLGRWLLRGQYTAPSAIISASDAQRVRFALLPAPDAVRLMCLAGAWTGVSSLLGLLRNVDVEAARAVLGEEAVAFASHAVLLPRPTVELMSAIGASEMPTEPRALLHCGAAMFGLAIGGIPPVLRARLRLRRPASIWMAAADACRNDSAGEDAFRAMRRLVRKSMPTWSHWFN
ncbi:hypothetical protein QN219_23470 [Sinorhizobium sp. 7-81]|uniref:hypothetical protein n=1 Tax=unclassified Sinorhizobium TaxID=2613772 RepID=UPI0024C44FC0|nr:MULTISPECIES: hypothetical protein [unclassified Sinorhizobium]MDK1389335.1 hypothetical protein [Sinorhizobium sp. 7-81]MDK1492976.1 hypothetical protein [Sinorhizobium sp. 8-89]